MGEAMQIQSVSDDTGRDLSPTDRLIMMAVQGNADLDKLERLIDLKNREEARQSKQDFDRHFAEMQAEFQPAQRTKKGYDYHYAPIEVLQRQYGPTIAKHGFSYRWREDTIETGKRCIMKISGHGHAEENSYDIPTIKGTQQMNLIQVAGAMSTYGRRYTFIAGFGVAIEDEDDDAMSIPAEEALKHIEQVRLIRESKTVEELRDNWKIVWGGLADGDKAGRRLLTEEKNKKRDALREETGE